MIRKLALCPPRWPLDERRGRLTVAMRLTIFIFLTQTVQVLVQVLALVLLDCTTVLAGQGKSSDKIKDVYPIIKDYYSIVIKDVTI